MNERKTVRQVRHVYTVQMFFFFKPIASFIHVYSTCLLPFSKARGLREDWSCGTAGMASFLRLPKSLGMDGGKIMGLWWMNHGFNGLVLREKRAGTRKTPICFVGKIDGFRLRFPQKTNPLRWWSVIVLMLLWKLICKWWIWHTWCKLPVYRRFNDDLLDMDD